MKTKAILKASRSKNFNLMACGEWAMDAHWMIKRDHLTIKNISKFNQGLYQAGEYMPIGTFLARLKSEWEESINFILAYFAHMEPKETRIEKGYSGNEIVYRLSSNDQENYISESHYDLFSCFDLAFTGEGKDPVLIMSDGEKIGYIMPMWCDNWAKATEEEKSSHQQPQDAEPEPQGHVDENGAWYGGRYDSSLSRKDICKKIRTHLKEESTKNPLFSGSKFSVRMDGYKGICITVMAMGFNPLSPERLLPKDERHHDHLYTTNGESFFDRIEELLNSYRFDGSDIQTDYFHTNFYDTVTLDYELSCLFQAEIEADLDAKVKEYRQKIIDSWPTCTQCGRKDKEVYSTEDGEHAGLCWTCYYPYYQAEQKRQTEQWQAERDLTVKKLAILKDVRLQPADKFIEIMLPNLNKQCSIQEYKAQLDSDEYSVVRGRITDRALLTVEQFDILAENLLENMPFLEGKGGCRCDIDFPGVNSLHQLDPEQMEVYLKNVYTLFVEVSAPGRETIYIDPQGHSYARYVGFAGLKTNTPLELGEDEAKTNTPLEFFPGENFPGEDQHPVRIFETENEPTQDVLRFKVGKTYNTRSIGDHNCIYSITIAKRTAKTIKTTEGRTFRPKVRTNHEGRMVETVNDGNYSFAHGWDATDDKVLLRDWEQRPKEKQDDQPDMALIAVENLLACVPVDGVMDLWHKESQKQPGANAIAFAGCDPARRWASRTPQQADAVKWKW